MSIEPATVEVTAGSRGKPTSRQFAWSLWLLSAVLLAIGFVLGELAGIGVRGLVESATYATVGAIVASRRPENTIGWLFCALGVVVAFEFFGTEYVTHAYIIAPGSLPVPHWVALATLASTELSIPLAIFVFFLFPYGRLLSAHWGVASWVSIAAGGAAALSAVLSTAGPSERLPFDEAAVESLHLADLLVASEALLGALLVASSFSVVLRQRRALGDERQQLKWFTCAVGIVVATIVVSIGVTGGDASLALWVTPAVPMAAGLAILRYRLYDIDVLINRTLVYSGLSAVLGLIYVLCVFALQQLLSPTTEHSELTVAGSTLAVAALFRPARVRVQDLINRRFYRTKYDAQRTLEAFSAIVRERFDLEDLTGELLAAVQEAMQPAQVSLWVRTSAQIETDIGHVTDACPHPVPDAVCHCRANPSERGDRHCLDSRTENGVVTSMNDERPILEVRQSAWNMSSIRRPATTDLRGPCRACSSTGLGRGPHHCHSSCRYRLHLGEALPNGVV